MQNKILSKGILVFSEAHYLKILLNVVKWVRKYSWYTFLMNREIHLSLKKLDIANIDIS